MKKFTTELFNPYLSIFENKNRRNGIIRIWVPKKSWDMILDTLNSFWSDNQTPKIYIGSKFSFGVYSGIEIENISRAENFFKKKPKTYLYSIEIKILSIKQKKMSEITQKEVEEFNIPKIKFRPDLLQNFKYFIKKNYPYCKEDEEGLIIECSHWDKEKDAPSDYEKAIFSKLDEEF